MLKNDRVVSKAISIADEGRPQASGIMRGVADLLSTVREPEVTEMHTFPIPWPRNAGRFSGIASANPDTSKAKLMVKK